MPTWNGVRRSITPNLSTDNWTLGVGANIVCRVKSISHSGEATATTAMHTRYAKSSGQTGTATAGNVEKTQDNTTPANSTVFNVSYATTQPTLNTGDLLALSWNDHGGIFYWHAGGPDEEWIRIGAATQVNISCRNTVGTGTSSYTVTWAED